MKPNAQSKLSTWLLWAPIKFALISFFATTIIAFVYSFIAGYVSPDTPLSTTPLMILVTVAIILCIAYSVYSLPRIKMDRSSFIAIHNAQTLIMTALFVFISYILTRNAQSLMLQLFVLETQSSLTFFLAIIALALSLLYITGISVANAYAKYQRIRAMGIPMWKVILSVPFGFSALWTPGYILETNTTKTPGQQISCSWYARLQNWILGKQTNINTSYVVVTFISSFFFGSYSVLLTFCLAIMFGIWALQVGVKKFTKNIGGTYATTAVILNIALIIIFTCFALFVSPASEVATTGATTLTQGF